MERKSRKGASDIYCELLLMAPRVEKFLISVQQLHRCTSVNKAIVIWVKAIHNTCDLLRYTHYINNN